MPTFTGVANIASDTLSKIEKLSISLTPVSVAANTAAEQTFSVPGLQVGDFVDISPPGITPGVSPLVARCSALNTLAVTFVNATAGALTPLAGVYQVKYLR